jgi:nicotinamide-nucleotide amidase
MLEQQIIPQLKQLFVQHQEVRTLRMQVFGIGESNIQKLMDEHFPQWPAEIELGFRVAMPLIELKLTCLHSKHYQLQQQWFEKIKHLLGDHIISEKQSSLAQQVLKLLQQANLKLVTAESCTGGMIASQLTRIPGASEVFEGGFVTYSNAMKSHMLQVDPELLHEQGAVSETVVRQMLSGALAASGADIGVAVSGIAGPAGGSADKPVGTVWIAWGNNHQQHSHCLLIPGGRAYFQQYVTAVCLDLLRRLLLKSNEQPLYFKNRQSQRTI